MHADEVDVDPSLVGRLVAVQFPEWAGLPIEPVLPLGTDNANYRLGDDMLVRLPRRELNIAPLEKECRWLPTMAPLLPLAVPEPIATGAAGEGYPFPWAVFTWIEGENATVDSIAEPQRTAADLAAFVNALRGIDPAGAPPALRRGPLRAQDERTRAAIDKVAGRYDAGALLSAWDDALAAPEWDGPPTWCHADLDLRNLLFAQGRLCGVLDFGGVGVGDPAADAAAAWRVLPADARDPFWSALDVDDASLARARGWLVFQCAMALSYYTVENNPALFLEAERWLSEVL